MTTIFTDESCAGTVECSLFGSAWNLYNTGECPRRPSGLVGNLHTTYYLLVVRKS